MERSGWAFGDRGVWNGEQSRYLTILGSKYERPKLYGTREEAESALARHPMRSSPHLNMVLAHVTEREHGGVSGGYAYWITEACERCGAQLGTGCYGAGTADCDDNLELRADGVSPDCYRNPVPAS